MVILSLVIYCLVTDFRMFRSLFIVNFSDHQYGFNQYFSIKEGSSPPLLVQLNPRIVRGPKF